ncbi:MAG: phenylacetic acid degradation protein [Proteobacteria bacterium ST_bin15]|nr:MAG: phenylacetic acid degradation protein [Proteobacteria bacterium ST_bin15]
MTATIKMTADDITAFLTNEFPQINMASGTYVVDEVAHLAATLRLNANEHHLRPGGTISGPAMMTLADLAMYVALLGAIGPVALAVTTSLNINFLRKPSPGALLAHCRLIKLGKRLAVGDIALRSEGSDALVAHATATYAIPTENNVVL